MPKKATKAISRRKKPQNVNSDTADELSDSDDGTTGVENIESLLASLHNEVKKTKQRLKNLHKKNKKLKQAPASEMANDPPPDRVPRSQQASLLEKIDRLQKDNKKKENEIKLFREKELREEAEALLTEKQLDAGAGSDPIHRMTKLLRRFYDLMMVTTLEDDGESEDCVICLEKMRLKKCYNLPCEHMICDECLPKMSKGADETVRCPTCRKVCPREDIELITYTEQDRWDALLKVAEAWGAGDRRGEAETSEEEAEENFVNDETQSSTSSLPANGAEDDGLFSDSGPQTVDRQPYLKSPVKEKRKRMEELAARKKRK